MSIVDEFFLSVEDLPLDTYDGGDHDDKATTRKTTGDVPSNLTEPALPTLMKSRRIAVPFKRLLKRGSSGRDVEALQRALVRVDCMRVNPPGNFFGPGTMQAVKRFQKRAGIKVDGEYGRVTHKALVAARAFDAYGAWLIEHAKVKPQKPDPKPSTESQKRKQIVAAAMFGYYNRSSIHYTQGGSRMYGVRNRIRPPRIPIWEDCSSYATWTYWVAGAPDPNKLNYNGFGYTGTQIVHGWRLSSVGAAQPGDLIFYNWPVSHVAIYVGNGRVISHGSESGPLLLSTWYRSDVNHARSYM